MKKVLNQTDSVNIYYSKYYLKEHQSYITPKRTAQEVDFLIDQLGHLPKSVCDLACGNGRHLLEFQSRGVPSGFGLEPNEIFSSQIQAKNQNPDFEIEKGDFASWQPHKTYGLVYTLFSSTTYCLQDTEMENLVQKMVAATSPGGKIIIDTENILASLGSFNVEYINNIRSVIFNPEKITLEARQETPDGILQTSSRYYLAPELRRFLESAGIKSENITFFGDFDGSRYSLESDRIIAVALKN